MRAVNSAFWMSGSSASPTHDRGHGHEVRVPVSSLPFFVASSTESQASSDVSRIKRHSMREMQYGDAVGYR